MDSYLSRGYLSVNEHTRLRWNSNMTLQVLIPSHYLLHTHAIFLKLGIRHFLVMTLYFDDCLVVSLKFFFSSHCLIGCIHYHVLISDGTLSNQDR